MMARAASGSARRGDRYPVRGQAVRIDASEVCVVSRRRCADWRQFMRRAPSIEPPAPAPAPRPCRWPISPSSSSARCSTVTWMPGRKPILDGACEAVDSDTVNTVSRQHAFFASTAGGHIGRHQSLSLMRSAMDRWRSPPAGRLPISASATSSASACVLRAARITAAIRKVLGDEDQPIQRRLAEQLGREMHDPIQFSARDPPAR